MTDHSSKASTHVIHTKMFHIYDDFFHVRRNLYVKTTGFMRAKSAKACCLPQSIIGWKINLDFSTLILVILVNHHV